MFPIASPARSPHLERKDRSYKTEKATPATQSSRNVEILFRRRGASSPRSSPATCPENMFSSTLRLPERECPVAPEVPCDPSTTEQAPATAPPAVSPPLHTPPPAATSAARFLLRAEPETRPRTRCSPARFQTRAHRRR